MRIGLVLIYYASFLTANPKAARPDVNSQRT